MKSSHSNHFEIQQHALPLFGKSSCNGMSAPYFLVDTLCHNLKVLISVEELARKFGISPKSVLHVGGHLGEEHDDMRLHGWGINGVYWIESQEKLCEEMRLKFKGTNNFVINATIWSENGVKKIFNENVNTQSSSLYRLGTHKESYPEFVETSSREVTTSTLDSLAGIPKDIEFINLDIQGAELNALKGATNVLKRVSWVYTEVNRKHVYESCPLVGEIDEFLESQGFNRVATRWSFGEDWGDALYSRQPLLIARYAFLISEFASNLLSKIRYTAHNLKTARK